MELLLNEIGWKEIKRRTLRQNITQFILASYAILASYMVWMLLCLFLNNPNPIACVLSESMEPGFKRGDILFIKPPKSYEVGDISVFQVYENAPSVVHRIIRKEGDRILTKGDNNGRDDVPLYKPGRTFLEPEELRANVFGCVSYLGIISVWILSIPGIKILAMLIVAFKVFGVREDMRSSQMQFKFF